MPQPEIIMASLNSCLEACPALQPDLVGILLRFRKNQLGVMGDIEKMFFCKSA